MADDPTARRGRWSLVVAVKRLPEAKSRLVLAHPGSRGELALAMVVDTVTAALSCRRVAGVVVVSDDDRVRREVARVGALGVGEGAGRGLNAAVRHGAGIASARWAQTALGALQGDLPALSPDELGTALELAAGHRAAFVADHLGTGTTLLLARDLRAMAPRFGPGSSAAHAAGGAVRIGDDLATLRLDVDTAADLALAARLGPGPRTRALLERVGSRAG